MVYLVVFDEKSFELSGELFGGIDSYISQNYVAEKEESEYSTSWSSDVSLAGGISSNSNRKFGRGLLGSARTSECFEEYNECSVQPIIDASTVIKKKSLDDCIMNLDKTFIFGYFHCLPYGEHIKILASEHFSYFFTVKDGIIPHIAQYSTS